MIDVWAVSRDRNGYFLTLSKESLPKHVYKRLKDKMFAPVDKVLSQEFFWHPPFASRKKDKYDLPPWSLGHWFWKFTQSLCTCGEDDEVLKDDLRIDEETGKSLWKGDPEDWDF